MAWKQWAVIKVKNNTTKDTIILRFPKWKERWGWTFAAVEGDDWTRNEVSLETLEGQLIRPGGGSFSYGHTGNADQTNGCSADLELWAVEDSKNTTSRSAGCLVASKICAIYYRCPWAGDNLFNLERAGNQWTVKVESDFQKSTGPLGHVKVTITGT